MRYVKTTSNIKDYKTKKLCFKNFKVNEDDEYLIQDKFAIQNLVNKQGCLVEESGIRELTMPYSQDKSNDYRRKFDYPEGKSFIKLFQYKYYSERNNRYDYSLIMLDNTFKVYHANMFMSHTNLLMHEILQFSEEPEVFKFRIGGTQDVICFCSPTEGIIVWDCDATPYVVEDAPKFKSICLHNSRLFVIDRQNDALIRYSSNKNPLDWTSTSTEEDGAGKIELNEFKGMIEKLISFLDNLYVFTKFGISKVSIFTSSSRYTISNIFSSSAKIYNHTTCVCGQNILFLTQDGLYTFDGYDVKKIGGEVSQILSECDQESAKTCYYDGKLYIACKLNFNDDLTDDRCLKNNALIVFDVETRDFSIIRNVDIVDMMTINELSMQKLVLCLNGQEHSGKLWEICSAHESELDFVKQYKIEGLTLGDFDKPKILKSIVLECHNDCLLKIKTEKGIKVFDISGKENLQRIRLNVCAKQFDLTFKSNNSQFLLKPPQFVFSLQKD